MDYAYSPPASVIAAHPVQALLAQFPIVCFTLTLLTDIAYWRTSYLMWQHFSEWLLLAGLVFGGLAALAFLVGLFSSRDDYGRGPAWPYGLGGAIVLVLAFVNSLVHARDGWLGVVPSGLVLSGLTVLLMIATGWLSRFMARRHRSGRAYR